MKRPCTVYLLLHSMTYDKFYCLADAVEHFQDGDKIYEITHKEHTSRASGETEWLPKSRRVA